MRLFMVPGVDHCSGGEGTFLIDALNVIDAWVESGQAPERLVASRPLAGWRAAHTAALPVSAGRALSRPGQHGRGAQLRVHGALTCD